MVYLLYENVFPVGNSMCKFNNDEGVSCKSRASFNNEGCKTGMFCKIHKQPDQVFVLTMIRCENIDCKTRAIYNFKKEKIRRFCEKHSMVGMLNITEKYCIVEECSKMTTHPDENGKKTMSMSLHVHHGLMDGYHVGEFLTFFQDLMYQ